MHSECNVLESSPNHPHLVEKSSSTKSVSVPERLGTAALERPDPFVDPRHKTERVGWLSVFALVSDGHMESPGQHRGAQAVDWSLLLEPEMLNYILGGSLQLRGLGPLRTQKPLKSHPRGP